jgi:hypothetical protein
LHRDHMEVDLWALRIGIRRLGKVCRQKRPLRRWHEQFVEVIKMEMEVWNKVL